MHVAKLLPGTGSFLFWSEPGVGHSLPACLPVQLLNRLRDRMIAVPPESETDGKQQRWNRSIRNPCRPWTHQPRTASPSYRYGRPTAHTYTCTHPPLSRDYPPRHLDEIVGRSHLKTPLLALTQSIAVSVVNAPSSVAVAHGRHGPDGPHTTFDVFGIHSGAWTYSHHNHGRPSRHGRP